MPGEPWSTAYAPGGVTGESKVCLPRLLCNRDRQDELTRVLLVENLNIDRDVLLREKTIGQ
jgi:hypothetical protein